MTETQDITSPMTAFERRATWSLASIYALRMLGLFMIMPVMSLYAGQLSGSTPTLIGLAIGIYGISQAILQIPFGLISDRIGRKKVIVFGLLLFCLGSVIAALATTIQGVIIGRAVQGTGAIAGPIMALLADLTQEVHRTKAMALIGASIGVSFGVAIASGPVLAGIIGFHGLFWLIAVLSMLAIAVILWVVPNPKQTKKHRDTELIPASFWQVLKDIELLRLNYGIFVLHTVLSASFVIIPLLMRDAGLITAQHWQVYLPVFIGSFLAIVPLIIIAEKKRKMKPVFLMAIVILLAAEIGLMQFHTVLMGIISFLLLFFCGFNLLEATLPSLVSKTTPGDKRGTAMGIYSTSQFLGSGIGGSIGGWCFEHYGAAVVFQFCAALVTLWFLFAAGMKPPRYWANLLISLQPLIPQKIEEFVDELLQVSGVEELTLHAEEGVAYLKVDNHVLDRSKLQQIINDYSRQ